MRAPQRGRVLRGALFLLGLTSFLGGRAYLDRQDPEKTDLLPGFEVVLPVPGALALTMGDGHLAANLAVIRALVGAGHLEGPEEKAAFARLLENSLTLAPAQEDGYYLAQATLPWWGYLETQQRLLKRASEARPWDWLPPFFRAFNLFYFRKAPEEGARFLRQAAPRSAPGNRKSLLALAGRWTALGADPGEALEIIQGMIRSTRQGPLRRNLQKRADQLRALLTLRAAARDFRKARGSPPERLEQLAGFGGLEALPTDPMGDGFTLNDQGRVIIRPPKALTQEPSLP